MKQFISILAVLILFATANVFSQSVVDKNHPKYETIQKNLLIGLNSDNTGVRMSSAYYLGEYKNSNAVFPLLKMLQGDCNRTARIQAAIALKKIQDNKDTKFSIVHRERHLNKRHHA